MFGKYTLSTDASDAAVRSQRHFTVDVLVVPVAYYAAPRSYFTLVRRDDEGQIVLEAGGEQNASMRPSRIDSWLIARSLIALSCTVPSSWALYPIGCKPRPAKLCRSMPMMYQR